MGCIGLDFCMSRANVRARIVTFYRLLTMKNQLYFRPAKGLIRSIPILVFSIAMLMYLVFANCLKAQSSYRLAALDTISVTIYGEADLSSEQSIDGTGHINAPLLGSIYLAGKTVRQAEGHIKKSYIEGLILRDPQVTVTIKSYVEQDVTVMGQVKNPGQVSFPRESSRMSIVEAISRAGGFSGVAKKTAVRVTRGKGSSRERTDEVNVYDLMEGDRKAQGQNYLLRPGDIVFVPERIF